VDGYCSVATGLHGHDHSKRSVLGVAADEYAVYEQAIYTLLRDANPSGTGADIPSLEPDEKQDRQYTLGTGRGKWSEEALAWLGASNRVETVMG